MLNFLTYAAGAWPEPQGASQPDADVDLNMDSRERRRLWIIIGIMLLIITLPYVWAAYWAHPDLVYSGLLFTPDDQNVHLSWMKQAAQGHFFFRDLFTTESLDTGQRPLFNNIFYFALGSLGGWTHIPLVWLYHAVRLLGAVLALSGFYRLCCLLTPDKRVRLVALLLVAFSSGSGWLKSVLPNLLAGHIFIDLPDQGFPLMPEAFTFHSAFIFPLFIASIALLVFIYLWTLQAQQTGRLGYMAAAGLAALLLGNIHTYDALPLAATLLIWMAHSLVTQAPPGAANTAATEDNALSGPPPPRARPRRARWLAPLLVCGCALLPVGWQYLVFRSSKEFSLKALTPTPPPPCLDLLLSYGPLTLLAVLGAIVTWRETRPRLMTLWVSVTLTFVYIPVSIFSFARKMLEGMHLPLCFLAANGLVWLLARLPSQLVRRTAYASFMVLSCISSAQFAQWNLEYAQRNALLTSFAIPLYLTPGDSAAFQYLDQQPTVAQPRVLLCLPLTGNYVPRETGLYTYVGHWAETLNFRFKFRQAVHFYNGQMPTATARAFLRDNHITYVLEGTYEKALLGDAPTPAQRLHLTKVYEKAGTALYRVPF